MALENHSRSQDVVQNKSVALQQEQSPKLKQQIQESIDVSQKPRSVIMSTDGKRIVIPYDRKGVKYDFVITRSQKNYQKTIVEMKIDGVSAEKVDIESNTPVSQDQLSQTIGVLLDKHVGKDRAKIPDKIKAAYKFFELQTLIYQYKIVIDKNKKQVSTNVEMTFEDGERNLYEMIFKRVDNGVLLIIDKDWSSNDMKGVYSSVDQAIQKGVLKYSEFENVNNSVNGHLYAGVRDKAEAIKKAFALIDR